MAIEKYKPTTPGRRKASRNTNVDLTSSHPHKYLTSPIKRKAGRNNQGKITVRHQGGGHKKLYRCVDFKQNKFDIPAKVASIEYDPNRTGRIGLLQYADGEKRYVLLPEGVSKGDVVLTSRKKIEIKMGNRLPIKFIPPGMMIYNLELFPGTGSTVARSAGNGAVIMATEENKSQIKLPSGEMREVSGDCMATVGQVSNAEKRNIRLGKAGRTRWKGIRPRVRGKAMNPVDHPHGGGEGNQPIGLPGPRTPSGKWALGVRTRNKKKKSGVYIMQRRPR